MPTASTCLSPDCQDDRRARLLDCLPAIAWSASAQTFRFTYVNPAAETLLGYPISNWLEQSDFWTERLHPDDRHVPMLCHNETLAGRNHELIYRMIAADGRTVWLRDYVNVHSVDGVPVELFGVMVDITREREAEAAALENRENFRRMVELSPDCIGVHVDGTYVYVNQAFVQLLGAKSEADRGRTVFAFVAPGIGTAERGGSTGSGPERACRTCAKVHRTSRLAADVGCGVADTVATARRGVRPRHRRPHSRAQPSKSQAA